ncbi:hypothetical protein PIB30_087456 [Stylosanthes scabra]|uniref:Uncharacterized protein n=1 Tax=Stylosanthes scabra TaxID=79078 RepID=A0ABU6ZS54_9FABA|nr:hypothetical protein [Stylosanthes scabra]
MYDPAVQINASWVREFYANFASSQQSEVFIRGKMIPFDYVAIQNVLRILALDGEDEYRALCGACIRNKLDLDKILRGHWEAKLWEKLIVCNMIPTGHETTMGYGASASDLRTYGEQSYVPTRDHDDSHE